VALEVKFVLSLLRSVRLCELHYSTRFERADFSDIVHSFSII